MTVDNVVLERVNGEWVPVHYDITVPDPLFSKAEIARLHMSEQSRRSHSRELDRDDLLTGDQETDV